ncbi:hypothetical protein ABEB36_005913 [Hypothenemus hampei]|uniref:Facilitated trehalose transporter Tret1-like n=1 Tax=Hypothenemus hampei TaxID=57062 RepID=A0ABD1EZV6_HYPHA
MEKEKSNKISEVTNGPEYKPNNGKQWSQVFSIFVVAISCFVLGMQFSWSSPFSVVISQDKINYNISEEDTQYFLIAQPIVLPNIVTFVIAIFATTKWEFYISRFCAGFGDTIFFCAGPPYIGEITTPSVRGYWGFLPLFFTYLGGAVITTLGSYLNVPVTAYICLVPTILFLILMVFLPESPNQLIRDKKYQEAKNSLKWLRRKSNVDDEFFILKAGVDRQLSEGGSFKDLIMVKTHGKAFRAGLFLRFAQQFAGPAVIYGYCQMIFRKAGSNFSPQTSSMILQGTAALITLIGSFGVERFGRKPTFVISIFGCGLILTILSIYFFIDQYNLVSLEGIHWFPLAGLMGFIFVFTPGVGLVPTIMLGEIFSASIKYKGLCVLSGAFGTTILLVSLIFSMLTTYVGLYGPFLIYGIACLVNTFLGLKWIPETKGKTLEEIQLALKK